MLPNLLHHNSQLLCGGACPFDNTEVPGSLGFTANNQEPAVDGLRISMTTVRLRVVRVEQLVL
jgi:hypothetical protein